MKKIFLLLGLIFLLQNPALTNQTVTGSIQMSEVQVYSEDGKFGLKDSDGNIIVEPDYKKMIRLGNTSWIIQKGCDRILFLFSHSDDFRSNGLFACEDISSRLQRAQLYLDIGYDDRICCRFHCFVCERTDRGQMALALRIVK